MDRILASGATPRQSGLVILAVSIALTGIGLINVLAATLPKAMAGADREGQAFPKQCLFVLAAMLICRLLSRYDYHRLIEVTPRIVIAAWIGLVVVLMLPPVNGARRWINLGVFGIQATELAKVAAVLGSAWYIAKRKEHLASYFKGFVPAALALGFTVVLIAAEPDFGTSLFIMGSVSMLLFLGGMPLSHILLTGAAALPFFVLVMIDKFRHVMDRLSSYRDGPHEQVQLALEAMASGGVLGEGIGAGHAPRWFVPYVESDFIFAAVGEQFGLIGSLAVVALFVMFFWHGVKIALRAPDQTGFILGFGLTFIVVFQALINMAVVTGLVPPKGIGLPFISSGGSSLLALGAVVGILWNIASHGAKESKST